MAKLDLTGTILKITRTNGKAFAQISLQVPVTAKSEKIPMGEVNLTIEPVQRDMFEK